MPQDLPERKPEPPEGPLRLPLGTRISLYYILVFFVIFVGGSVLAFLLIDPAELEGIRAGQAPADPLLLLRIEALLAPLLMAMTAGFIRFADKKPLYEFGIRWPPPVRRRAVRDLTAAVVGAAVLLGLWYVVAGLAVRIEVGIGDESRVEEATGAGLPLLLLLLFLGTACLEEWILRGYIFSSLRERFSWVHSGGITALIFTLVILPTPGLSTPALVNTFLLGLLLAALRELSGSLWPGVAFRVAWNFLMGYVLSLPVSGLTLPGLHQVTVTGSDFWSGGDFGPEGSWLMVILLLLTILAFAGVLSQDEEAEDDEDD